MLSIEHNWQAQRLYEYENGTRDPKIFARSACRIIPTDNNISPLTLTLTLTLTEKLKIDFFAISKIAMDIVENNFIYLTLLLTYTRTCV